jgi:hypothetical protein
MNTIECHIDKSATQRNEQEFSEFQLVMELDDSQLKQVAGGKEAIIPTRVK